VTLSGVERVGRVERGFSLFASLRLDALAALAQSALAPLALGLLALCVAAPGLGNGLLAFGDNPAHLAEIRELARAGSTGWSDLAFGGFPLDSLQSPLTFGGLAWLSRAGVALEPAYQALSVVALAAPSLAMWVLARRRVSAPAAFVLASSLLLYRGSLATLHGMFSFGLGSAAWLLALDRLTQRRRSLRHFAGLAALAAFIGLTHMYVTIALVYLGAVHGLLSLRSPVERRKLLWDFPALGLGALAAAAYWLPNVLSKTRAQGQADQVGRILSRLFTVSSPAPPLGTHGLARLAFDPVWFVDGLLQLLVVLAGAAGVLLALRGRDRLPRYAAVLAAVWLVLLVTQRWLPIMALGPQNERFVFFVKYTLVVAALPAVAQLESRLSDRATRWLAASFVSVGALLCARLVAREAVPSTELAEAENLWRRVGELDHTSWGRVLVQDTFGPELGTRLDHSHLLAETAQRAGVEQVGAFYGNTPYDRRELWLSFDAKDLTLLDRSEQVMQLAGATHLLLVDPNLHRLFAGDGRFERLLSEGRYALFALRNAESRWLSGPGAPGARLSRVQPGELTLTLGGSSQPLVVSESFHPFWRVEPASAARLERSEQGWLQLVPRTQARALRLRYEAPHLPRWLTVVGLAAIALTVGVDLVWKRSRRLVATSS
jgi:hypothetical protein